MEVDYAFWLNEIRIPVESIGQIPVDTCSFSGLSAGHKRSIEIRLWAKYGRLSLFDGNVLYSLPTKDSDQNDYLGFLREYIKKFTEKNVTHTTMSKVSEKVVERIVFWMIAVSARKSNYFVLDSNKLFELHNQSGKRAFRTIDFRIRIEDDFIKINIVPSMSVLFNIEDTNREKVYELELIKFCKFRDTCPVMAEKKCRYAFPDRVGYYVRKSKLSELPDKQKKDLESFYKDCPQFTSENDKNLIWVKATRKSENPKAYPSYLLYTNASNLDLEIEGLTSSYREETLLSSHRRFSQTQTVINKIFGNHNSLQINDLILEFDNVFSSQGSTVEIDNHISYASKFLQSSKVTSNPNYPNGSQFSGGWQFQTFGSFDRNSPQRPFNKIQPLILMPDVSRAQSLVNKLMVSLSDGYNKKRNTIYPDGDFDGLNTDVARGKFNVEFVSPKEGDMFSSLEQEYISSAHRLKKLIVAQQQENPNLVVIVILPENRSLENEHPLYFKLKKIFVEDGIPSQFLSYEKLLGIEDPSIPFGSVLWNLFLDIYVKLGGKPWKLTQAVGNVNCFIGVGFAINPRTSQNHIYAGVANVFDRYGNWLDVTSDYQDITEDERNEFFEFSSFSEGTQSFKISRDVTNKIVKDSLELYSITQSRQGNYPKNIVFHKLGNVYDCEIEGFLDAISSLVGTFKDVRIGISSIHSYHLLRLYGTEIVVDKKPTRASRVISRGTSVELSVNKELLATTGRMYRKDSASYYGIGTPRPLLIESIIPNDTLLSKFKIGVHQFYSTEELTSHIYALTQLHWGSLREDIRYPITVLYAKRVADIISKTENLRLNTKMAIKRPWFI